MANGGKRYSLEILNRFLFFLENLNGNDGRMNLKDDGEYLKIIKENNSAQLNWKSGRKQKISFAALWGMIVVPVLTQGYMWGTSRHNTEAEKSQVHIQGRFLKRRKLKQIPSKKQKLETTNSSRNRRGSLGSQCSVTLNCILLLILGFL